jgi:hypothetical protein
MVLVAASIWLRLDVWIFIVSTIGPTIELERAIGSTTDL